MKYVVCGLLARMMAEMALARSLADQRGKVLLFHHPTPDVTEVTMFLAEMAGAKITVIDATDVASINSHLGRGTENVLITNGDSLSLSFQVHVGDMGFRWPKGWSLLASKDGGALMLPMGPWATCFATNAIWRSKIWKNVGQRPKDEVMEMVRGLFTSLVVEEDAFSIAPNAMEPIETLIRGRLLPGLDYLLDLSLAARLVARQDHRYTVTAADVVTAIAVKGHAGRRTPTATPDQVAATATAG